MSSCFIGFLEYLNTTLSPNKLQLYVLYRNYRNLQTFGFFHTRVLKLLTIDPSKLIPNMYSGLKYMNEKFFEKKNKITIKPSFEKKTEIFVLFI